MAATTTANMLIHNNDDEDDIMMMTMDDDDDVHINDDNIIIQDDYNKGEDYEIHDAMAMEDDTDDCDLIKCLETGDAVEGGSDCCTRIMTQCEEDRILLEAFLNETDIDLIENDGLQQQQQQQHHVRNIRQVSDGTASAAAAPSITAAAPDTVTVPTEDETVTLPPGGTITPAQSPPPATTIPAATTTMTGRPPTALYLSCNPDYLSEYQCLIRKHIELFEASQIDVDARIKGRNKPIVLGQVGIRCMFCKFTPPQQRGRGAMYYPHTLLGIYQAAQILSQGHFLTENICPFIPPSFRQELQQLKQMNNNNNNNNNTNKRKTTLLSNNMYNNTSTNAGKDYWAVTAQALGVYEDEHGLRFEQRLGPARNMNMKHHLL